jgi:hypothetical protein
MVKRLYATWRGVALCSCRRLNGSATHVRAGADLNEAPADWFPKVKALFSSDKQTWKTPKWLYSQFVPPCFDTSDRHGETFDALKDKWPEPWFCNPPFGRGVREWTGRMAISGSGIALLPVRTNTRWFQDDVAPYATDIYFLRKSPDFDDCGKAAPFPVMVIFYRNYRPPNWSTGDSKMHGVFYKPACPT